MQGRSYRGWIRTRPYPRPPLPVLEALEARFRHADPAGQRAMLEAALSKHGVNSSGFVAAWAARALDALKELHGITVQAAGCIVRLDEQPRCVASALAAATEPS